MARRSSSGGGGGGAAGMIGALVLALALFSGGNMTALGTMFSQFLRDHQPTFAPTSTATKAPSKTPTVQQVTWPAAGEARRQLAALTTSPRSRGTGGYSRAQFGKAWADTDRNGCNTRDDILFRDMDKSRPHTVQRQGACPHDVIAGTFPNGYRPDDPPMVFTNLKDTRQAQAIQIDHRVALSEAWKSGADQWTAERRLAFANWQPNLVPTDGSTNASKSDIDPAGWKPKKAAQCLYARQWISTKTVWQLTIDPAEKQALGEMLDTCAA